MRRRARQSLKRYLLRDVRLHPAEPRSAVAERSATFIAGYRLLLLLSSPYGSRSNLQSLTWHINGLLPPIVFAAILSVTASLFLGKDAAKFISRVWQSAFDITLSVVKALIHVLTAALRK